MFQRITMILIVALLTTSCGAAAPAPTEAPAPVQPPAASEEPTLTVVTEPNPPVETTAPISTNTPAPTPTPVVTPTDTPLPTLVLPTEAANLPVRQVWDGTPTYLGDSTPGYSFRVIYDPDVWALTVDQFGFPSLGHRTISNCIISVTSGRGLPPNMSVEHEMLQTGNANFDVTTASENGVKQFVTFTGGDGTILTAFQVTFQEEVDACLTDALTVLSTLKSIPVSQATPVP